MFVSLQVLKQLGAYQMHRDIVNKKEGIFLFNDALNTFYLQLYGVRERERNVLFNDALTHFIYGYMASYIWLRTILIVREETRCRHIDYSYRLTARVLLYAPSHRQNNTYHGLCYTSRGALAGTRNSSMGPPRRIDPTIHGTTSRSSGLLDAHKVIS